MSRTLMPYAVDLAALRDSVGSEDEVLAQSALRELAEPEQQDALRALIVGTDLPDDKASCLHAVEGLCGALGVGLSNASVAPLDFDLVDRVDAILGGATGGKFGLSDLIYTGPPIELPGSVDDYPQVGVVEADAVKEALACLQDNPLESDVDTVDDILVEVKGWLEVAAVRSAGLVGFLY